MEARGSSIVRALLPLALLLVAAPARADEVGDLLDRADRVFRGRTAAAVLEMEVKTSSFTRSYKIVSWDDTRGDRERVLVKILGPALWRGHGTLKLGERLQMYDPKTNHVTLVSSSMLGDSWMGSHFTNDDLVRETRLSRDYTHRLERKWTARSDLGEGTTFYQIALAPRPTAPVAWHHIVYQLAARGEVIVPVRADYYRKARDRAATRSIAFTELRELGGRVVPAVMTVTVASEPGEHTRLEYVKLQLDADLPDSKFTEQALRR
jgi:hypothetical protein